MDKRILFGDFVRELYAFLQIHPEYANYDVCTAAESGWSGVCIASPLTVLANEGYEMIHLLSCDDMSIKAFEDCGYKPYYMDTFK